MAGLNGQRVLNKVEAETRVVEFTPREFPQRLSEAATEFVKFQSSQDNPNFKIDRVVSQTTGIAELEKVSLAERVENEALERLKAMQEEVYKQGYDLGRDEGQESAFQEMSEDLKFRIQKIDEVVHTLESLKTELVRQNEAALIHLVYKVAAKIAMTELKQHPELILPIIQQAASESQNEESIVIRLSQSDLDFVEQSKARLGKEFDFIKRAKLEPAEGVQPGGCVIVTNFGQVDATVDKRLEKVWDSMKEQAPKTSDVLSEKKSEEES